MCVREKERETECVCVHSDWLKEGMAVGMD